MLKIYEELRTDTVLQKASNEFGCVEIQEGVDVIDERAFSFSKVESVTLPTSLRKIGKYAFWCCHNLCKVVIPEGVQEIGEYAFSCCDNLKYISIPSTVLRLGENAFENCIRLEKVIAPLHLVYRIAEMNTTAVIEIQQK